VGRPYEGEGTEPSTAPGSRRGLPRRGRADEDSETAVASPVGAAWPGGAMRFLNPRDSRQVV
jgi:hypothetical protein